MHPLHLFALTVFALTSAVLIVQNKVANRKLRAAELEKAYTAFHDARDFADKVLRSPEAEMGWSRGHVIDNLVRARLKVDKLGGTI